MSEVEEIDHDTVAQLKELMGERYALLNETYVINSDKYLEAAKEAVQCKDVQGVIDAIHALRSASGNMGFVALNVLCGEMEDAARKDADIDVLSGMMPDVEVLQGRARMFAENQQ